MWYTTTMYVGVDIGGTKTLVAVLNNHGEIREERKFPTPRHYDHFLLELRNVLVHFKEHEFHAAGVGMPVTVFDRKHGEGINFGNLPWRNVPVQHDLEKILKCPVVLENDAKMAALSEAMLLKDEYSSVLYITVSTGIGYGLVVDGEIDPNIGDGGGRTIVLDYKGKHTPWESFASGHAIVERYGKMAKDIRDDETWKKVSRDIAKGLIELIAITEPQAVVVGGSVGTYFNQYHSFLSQELKKYHVPLMKMPKLLQAQRPEKAVVYGCYDRAKQLYGAPNAATHQRP